MAPIPTLAPGECGYAYKKKPTLTESANEVVDVSQDLDDDKKIARKLHQALMRLDPRITVEA